MNAKTLKYFMKWKGGNCFPPPFNDKSSSSNVLSKYTEAAGGRVNRVSTTVVDFILEKYYVDSYMAKSNVALGTNMTGTNASAVICEMYVRRNTNDGGVKGEYQIAIWEESTGELEAFIVDEDDMSIEKYVERDTHSGRLLLHVLWEAFMLDEEFQRCYRTFFNKMGNAEYDEAWDALAIISDNIYRRLIDDRINVILNCACDASYIEQIKKRITEGVYIPTNVISGEFQFLMKKEQEQKKTVSLDDFVGKYKINEKRKFTKEEKTLMENNRLEDYYIVGDDDIEICNDIIKTSNLPKPFRTFTLVGPPGTGKSHKVKAIANAVGLPEVIQVCNPSTEIFDFIGQMMPPSMDDMEKESWDLASKVEELGGLNFNNIATIYNLPNALDVQMCPGDVYEEITGSKKTERGTEPTIKDALEVWTVHMTDKFNEALRKMTVAMKTGTGFKYTETDFIKGIKNGWTIEIQEPNVILNEGVLVGLNSILNEGVITLQDGKRITRHPDSLVFFTTNHDLNGLRDMNQSFFDRSSEVFYVERPSTEVVADRVISISGNTDRKLILEMCKLSESIQRAMDKEGIDDGICGMRSLINWAIKATYTNPYDAAIKTMINKTSLDEKNRRKLQKKLDESYFYQFKGK